VLVSRDVISDEAWAVLGPLFPAVKATGRPPVDRRTVVEATAWRFRTGAPWRDLPERFGNWNTPYMEQLTPLILVDVDGVLNPCGYSS
jgi:transposase